MRCAIYARVSTDDKEQNPETQLRICREYCEKAGYEVVGTYVDKARAKDYKRRKRWAQLLKDARQRKFGGVICMRLDRPFRTVIECSNVITEWLDMNIKFKAVQQDVVDTTTSSGRFITWILAAAAELESAWIGERVKAGMARAKAEGKPIGRRPLKITLNDVIQALQNETSIAAAARVLDCSRRHIYRVCEEHNLHPLEILQK